MQRHYKNHPFGQIGELVDAFFGNEKSLFEEWKGQEVKAAAVKTFTEDEKGVTVEVDMPGLELGDIKVSIERRQLEISGMKKRNGKVRNYQYSTVLPRSADPETIEARYENGVLTVTAKKFTEKVAKKKEIPITMK